MPNRPRKSALYMIATLREDTDEYAPITFLLPVHRAWWEAVTHDLHLQFVGHEDRNIMPHQNAHLQEMKVPKEAKVFRKWLQSVGGSHKGSIHFQTCDLEVRRPTRRTLIPPADALDDLIDHWVSPNGGPVKADA